MSKLPEKPRQGMLFDNEPLPPERSPWEVAADHDRLIADVVFDVPVDQAYGYLIPAGLTDLLRPGCRVEAPFGHRQGVLTGYCVAVRPLSQVVVADGKKPRWRELTAVLDRDPLLTPSLLQLTRWIADEYLCSWGQVLNAMIPAGVKSKAGSREMTYFRIPESLRGQSPPQRLAKKQLAVWQALQQAGRPLRVDELSEAAACGASPIHALRDAGLIVAERERTATDVLLELPTEPAQQLTLNAEQATAVGLIVDVLAQHTHATLLLHGVTGSGKTEVYIRAIEEVLQYRRQAIVLVPEISLTPQTIRRFRSRFRRVAVLHSHLTDAERHAYWRRISAGEVDVVVGARSAVFAPLPHLGLIIIDEEHETSFKQDRAPRYHAREVARQRCLMEHAPLVLGTATPTLESWRRAMTGKDRLITLAQRVSNLPLPPVTIVDVRDDPLVQRGGAISRPLIQAMGKALEQGGQIILFLNVRGYSPVLWCRGCGTGVQCPDCDVTLTWHKKRNEAVCHSCDYAATAPSHCPRCQKPGLLYLGVGTERLEQEVLARFPQAAVLRMDSDTMQARGSHDAALTQFREGNVNVLLGTQMIAKGLDFPNVTLVGVVDADTLLHQPDLRAAERTFQLIAQVAGRTGRSARGGRVLVQTSSPRQSAIVCAAKHDFLTFAEEEMQHRLQLGAPPFTHCLRVIMRGEGEPKVMEYAEHLVARLRANPTFGEGGIKLLGPAPCLIARVQKFYRYHAQLFASSAVTLQQLWRSTEPMLEPSDEVTWAVDIDPLNLR